MSRKTQKGISGGVRRQPVIPPARSAALLALDGCLDRGLDIQSALDRALRQADEGGLIERDAALATELAYGWLRRRLTLDCILDRFLREPGRLTPSLRRTLGLAAYEIVFLDRIPAYASVNWAVDQATILGGVGAGKMANAVLRRVADLGPHARDPEFYREGSRNQDEYLARRYSCPVWLVGLWRAAVGPEELIPLLEAQTHPAPLGLRFNASRPQALELFAGLRDAPGVVSRTRHGLALESSPAPLPDWETAGLVSRQSLAAQQALEILEPESWTGPVWDACCGRGGKSAHLAELGVGPLWCSDPNLRRLSGLSGEFARLGLPMATIFSAQAQRPPLSDRPASILLDAPCSGLGVLSRRPDAKWKRKPGDLRQLCATQARMLGVCFDLLPSGGRLGYVTCTINREENENRVAALLSGRRDARLATSWSVPADSALNEFFFAALILKK